MKKTQVRFVSPSEERWFLERQVAINIIQKRAGFWKRKTKRIEKKVSYEELIKEIQKQPLHAVSFDKNVTKVIINLENVYGQVYEQIIYEKI
jgi:hypothetical protein